MARALSLAFLYNTTQMFLLGLGRDGAATTGKVLKDELNNDALLEDLVLQASQPGMVDDIKVGGQSVMCSDQSADLSMFHPEAYFEGARSFGFPIHKSVPVQVNVTLAANGTLVGSLGIQPIPEEVREHGIPDVNGLGDALDVVFGMGSVVVNAGATNTLSAKALRRCTLGALVLSATGGGGTEGIDVEVTDIQVNKKSLLGGSASFPLGTLSNLATDLDGRVLAQEVDVNHQIVIFLKNNNAANITVRGGIWCMPPRE